MGVFRCAGCGAPVDGGYSEVDWELLDIAGIPRSEYYLYDWDDPSEFERFVAEHPPKTNEPIYKVEPWKPTIATAPPSKLGDFWEALQVIIGIAFVIGFVYVLINDHLYLWPFINWLFS